MRKIEHIHELTTAILHSELEKKAKIAFIAINTLIGAKIARSLSIADIARACSMTTVTTRDAVFFLERNSYIVREVIAERGAAARSEFKIGNISQLPYYGGAR